MLFIDPRFQFGEMLNNSCYCNEMRSCNKNCYMNYTVIEKEKKNVVVMRTHVIKN